MDEDTSYDITVTGAESVSGQLAVRLSDAVAATLQCHQTKRARIALAVVDDTTIATLNEQHLQHAGPTDVLTFDLRDDATTTDDSEPWDIDGEVVISRDTAEREAACRDHGTPAELALYAVHGTLHLLGYTDADPTASEIMHQTEDKILDSIGLGSVYDGNRSP